MATFASRPARGLTRAALAACLLLLPALATGAHAAGNLAPEIALVPFATGLDKPTAIAHAGDGSGRLFIVLQDGRILVHDGEAVMPEPFLDIRDLVSCCGERGLLGLAFHPGYAATGLFYVDYTNAAGDTVIARYSVSTSDPDRADRASAAILLTIPQPFSNHNGGQLQFGPDRFLYIGMGDGGSAGDPGNRAQDPSTLLGKILRIDVDGGSPYAVPPDNPFVSTAGARPEIWALGLRNPWRFAFDRATGDLLIGDVGQGQWEEVDFQPAASAGGENYGWRLMEGTHCFDPAANCSAGGLTPPIIEYSHALGCSVTGGYRYRGTQAPSLDGVYLYGDFCSGRIWGASEDGTGRWSTAELLDSGLLISAFGEDEAGELYVAHRPDVAPGAVYRIVAVPHPVPAVGGLAPASVIAGDPGFTLLVSGAGFVPSSVVRWNGQDRPTTFVSDSELTAEVAAADIAAAGPAAVTVFTPAPGGGLSSAAALEVDTTFLDVPTGFWAAASIDALADAGITSGCGGRRFCPDATLTRAEMAIFLWRELHGAASPPDATGNVFGDVPKSSFGAAWIEQIAAMGLTAGCGAGRYCPDRAITRGEIAVLLVRARHGATFQPPVPTVPPFSDVPVGHPFAAWIQQLAVEGITSGCGGGRYCPSGAVTRAEMAVFLVRAFARPR